MATRRKTLKEEMLTDSETGGNQPSPTSGDPQGQLREDGGRTLDKPKTSSWWQKAKGYAGAAKNVTRHTARKVQTRSAAYDATRAADKTEAFMMEVSATVTGLTKTAVATSIGSLKGIVSGTAKGTRPLYVKALHAADAIVTVGSWNESIEYRGKMNQPQYVVTVDLDPRVAERYGIKDGKIDVTNGVDTHMELDGRRTSVLARPIFDQDTEELVGVFVFVTDEDAPGGKEVLLHEDGFEHV